MRKGERKVCIDDDDCYICILPLFLLLGLRKETSQRQYLQKMDDVDDDKTISMCWLYAGHIQNEQINERINEGEEKAVKKRKRRIFHANQINDNLCMYKYICMCVSVSITSRICIYQKLILPFSSIYSINFTLITNDLHICRCFFLIFIFQYSFFFFHFHGLI